MGVVKKSITVTEQQDQWIKGQVEMGKYANESEVIRELIRERQADEFGREALSIALEEGERSGYSTISPEALLSQIKEGYGRSD